MRTNGIAHLGVTGEIGPPQHAIGGGIGINDGAHPRAGRTLGQLDGCDAGCFRPALHLHKTITGINAYGQLLAIFCDKRR